MKKLFEYHIVDHEVSTHEINKLGIQGWELVSVTRVIVDGMLRTEYTFKREFTSII